MNVARKFLVRRLWLGVGVAVLLAGWPRMATAHNPAISLDPNAGLIGTVVKVSVTGFDPDREAEAFWNQESIGAFHIGSDGSGNTQFSVPAVAPGMYQVLVLCMTCQPPIGERAEAWFEVVAGDVTPTSTESASTATASPPTPLLTVIPSATPTLTCESVGACTSTPTLTSPPPATATSTPTVVPTSPSSATVLPPSPTLTATSTSCHTQANCTATPTRARFTPSLTPSTSPTPELTLTASVSPLPTLAVTPSQTALPTHTTTPTATRPPLVLSPSITAPLMVSATPSATVRGIEAALATLTILLGSLVIFLGGWLSGWIRWPFGRSR